MPRKKTRREALGSSLRFATVGFFLARRRHGGLPVRDIPIQQHISIPSQSTSTDDKRTVLVDSERDFQGPVAASTDQQV